MFNNDQLSLATQDSRSDLKPPMFFDPILLFVTAVFVCFSIVMIYSTTAVPAEEKMGDTWYYVKRQVLGGVLGFVLMWFFAKQPLQRFRRVAHWLYPLAIFLLLLLYIPGIGSKSGGAQRWIDFKILKLQPAELVKIFFVIFIADFFARRESEIKNFVTGLLIPFIYFAPIAALLLMQPDFGSTAIIAVVVLAMAVATGVRLRYIVYGIIVLSLGAAGLVVISPYRMQRILTFLSPMEDVQGSGYQLTQSLIGVAAGYLTGTGLGNGMQKLFFLPAAHTDFLFAVIAEELGFLGAVATLIGFLIFMIRGFVIASRVAENTFAFNLAIGATLLIVAPALTNMGVVMGLLPTKGLVLPLLGYGGSSLMVSLATVGILLALARAGKTGRI